MQGCIGFSFHAALLDHHVYCGIDITAECLIILQGLISICFKFFTNGNEYGGILVCRFISLPFGTVVQGKHIYAIAFMCVCMIVIVVMIVIVCVVVVMVV